MSVARIARRLYVTTVKNTIGCSRNDAAWARWWKGTLFGTTRKERTNDRACQELLLETGCPQPAFPETA